MQNETHLRDIIFSSLRPYSIIVDPAPVLSLSLDISTMVHWYTDALEAEIKVYMHNVFIVSRQQHQCLHYIVLNSFWIVDDLQCRKLQRRRVQATMGYHSGWYHMDINDSP